MFSTHGFSKENPGITRDSLLDNRYRASFYFNQRQLHIHSRILSMYSGTYIDSMNIVITILTDSIRNELSKTKVKDSITYLQTTLNNTLKDSLLLAGIGKLLTSVDQAKFNFDGVLAVHCMDATNALPIDSVAMDLFSGNSLIASEVSDIHGFIHLKNIPGGNYSVVFSRRGYAPCSIMNIKVTSTSQSYLDIPLKKQTGYFIQMISENSWPFLGAAVTVLLIIICVLAYFLAKIMLKRQKKAVE